MADLIRQIYKDKGLIEIINEDTVRYYADLFWKAATEGYGEDLTSVDFNTPDYVMLEKLQKDVWRFSAAKDYQQLRALTDALVDTNGQIRSFKDFNVEASQVLDEYNKTWLKTEYNFAIAGGQMAAKWQQIQNNKELLPFLKYVTVGDDRVRPAHRELEGIVRPVDDLFWDLYYPPNGWNCRCTVKQLDNEDPTPWDQIKLPEQMHDIFKTNLGKQGLIFPPKSPYYDGLPDDVKQKAEELRKKYG